MSDMTDIRDWAREHGHDIGAKGRIPAQVQAAYDAAHPEILAGEFVPIPDAGETPPFDAGSGTGSQPGPGSATPAGAPSAGGGETPPKAQKRRLRDRLKAPTVITDAPTGRRRSLERWCDRGWRVVARLAGAPDTPTGRIMDMQAPVAGMMLDDMAKGTIVDKFAQPLARFAESSGEAWGLIGPPLMVAAIERIGPVPVLVEALRDSLKEWVTVAGPAMARQRARERKVLESAQAFAGEGERVESVDALIDELLAQIFAGWAPPAPAEPEPAAA